MRLRFVPQSPCCASALYVTGALGGSPTVMLNLPRRVLLALAAIIDIAHHARTEPVSLKTFAERSQT